eukprot:scaffold2349_cov74-Skeletonema_dohrnii-CCMP3373.AAC.3
MRRQASAPASTTGLSLTACLFPPEAEATLLGCTDPDPVSILARTTRIYCLFTIFSASVLGVLKGGAGQVDRAQVTSHKDMSSSLFNQLRFCKFVFNQLRFCKLRNRHGSPGNYDRISPFSLFIWSGTM